MTLAVVPALSSYGFLLQLSDDLQHEGQRRPPAVQKRFLIDPLNWLTMVLAEFLHPLQSVSATSGTEAIPFLTSAEVHGICQTHLQLPIDQVYMPYFVPLCIPFTY